MLSKMEFSYKTSLRPDSVEMNCKDDENDCDDEIFVDAHDFYLQEF